MKPEDIFGTMAMLFGIATVLIGLSAHAVKNFNEKRCGNPLILAILSMSAYLSLAAYAITIEIILYPDPRSCRGVVIVATILFQRFHYKS